MTHSLWFVVPAAGRVELARICLTQLRRTCDALALEGVDATAVVIADDENLDIVRALGFGTVERDNQFVSRKFNDGIQLACDPAINPRPADYVVPFGSDDWADHRLFLNPPPPDTIVGFQHISFVREDGREIAVRYLNHLGGSGIRIIPRQLLAPLDYRPADEDRYHGCDTSILVNLSRHHGDRLRIEHRHLHDRQIVDWKTPGEQLTPYDAVARRRSGPPGDPFVELAGVYPDVALEEMRAHYEQALVAA